MPKRVVSRGLRIPGGRLPLWLQLAVVGALAAAVLGLVTVAMMRGQLMTRKVAPSAAPALGTFPPTEAQSNPDGALKPEMFASFSIITGAASSAPSVPADAVVYEGGTAHVWVANEAEKSLALRNIRVGRVHDDRVGVLAGLTPGEKVATAGALFIDRAAKGE